MGTTTINYKEVFQLAQDKGCEIIMFDRWVHKHSDDIKNYVIPLQITLIQKWLRDKYKIYVLPRYHKIDAYSYWIIRELNELPIMPDNAYDSYESALIHGINEALKLI